MMEIVMSIKLYKWFASYRGIEYLLPIYSGK